MKKISTLALLICMGTLSAWAQTTNVFRFVDKNGKEVPDGSVLTITATEDDGWGGIMMKTGLYIKSSQSGTVYGNMVYNIQQMDNGAFQVCFPENCTQSDELGVHETPVGAVTTEDIQAEWLPETYGTATVTLQPKTYRHNNVTGNTTFVADGPKITLNFIYSDPAAIAGTATDVQQPVGYYTIDGRQQAQPQQGITIVKTADGTTRKVFMNQ